MEKQMILITFLGILSILSCKDNPDGTIKESCDICHDYPKADHNEIWETFLGTDTLVGALPDYHANYWAYSYANLTGAGIRIQGIFSKTRYMSFTLYDASTGNELQNITDVDILPDCDQTNPFLIGMHTSQQSYTIHIVPNGTDISCLQNPLYFDSDLDSISIILRYYVPEIDPFGSTPLPSVSAFNPDDGNMVNHPNPFSLRDTYQDTGNIADAIENFFNVQFDENIRFYNLPGNRLFANSDNQYLVTPLSRINEEEVFLIRFKAPNNNANQTRYWSVNISNEFTRTFNGIKDEDFIIASDGFVNVVIAKDTEANRVKAQGLNFIPWNIASDNMLLVYRMLLPNTDFEGSIHLVPELDGSNNLNIFNQASHIHIGDYGPIGLRMDQSSYLEDFGGFQVSY